MEGMNNVKADGKGIDKEKGKAAKVRRCWDSILFRHIPYKILVLWMQNAGGTNKSFFCWLGIFYKDERRFRNKEFKERRYMKGYEEGGNRRRKKA